MKTESRCCSLLLATLALSVTLGCTERGAKSSRSRSDAVSSASREMSGPALFSNETLAPALQALRARADGKLLRLEIRAHEIVMQAEDTSSPGAVLELHYRDGKVGEPEHAALRGKGRLSDTLFELDEVKLDALAQLTREAINRVDAESGTVDWVLIRRNLPDSDEVRMRVYVSSPRKCGHVDADSQGSAL
jgi:hypothetical protein